jgi:hypothetical protein
MDYEDILEVYCDGCDKRLGICTPAEWDEQYRKTLNLCGQCDVSFVTPDTLRRIGNLVLAAQVERQDDINRSIVDYGEVLEFHIEDGEPVRRINGEDLDIPF